MRTITLIIIHCSATRVTQNYSFDACRQDHIHHRGYTDIGYHYYITKDGVVHEGRPLERNGAHCLHHNKHSIGICYEGGLNASGQPADTRTKAQKAAMEELVQDLKWEFPKALVLGHRELNPQKDCPCFDAVSEYNIL